MDVYVFVCVCVRDIVSATVLRFKESCWDHRNASNKTVAVGWFGKPRNRWHRKSTCVHFYNLLNRKRNLLMG